MADHKGSTPTGKKQHAREDRLKAALKANLARRKAQQRVRTQSTKPENATSSGPEQDKDA